MGGPWYLAGGIAVASCVAAYKAKGAASQVASYVNLTGNATYNLTTGGSPDWDAVNGWKIDSVDGTKYLDSHYVPTAGNSLIIRFSNATTDDNKSIIGEDTSDAYFAIWISHSSQVLYCNGGLVHAGVAATSGVLAVAGQQGYRDGVADGDPIAAWSAINSKSILIGTAAGGYIAHAYTQAVALYNTVLTAPQVAAVSTAMAAL